MEDSGNSPENRQKPGLAGKIVPAFIRRSFVRKFVATLLIVLVVVGAVSAVAYAQTSAQLSEDVESEYTGVADRYADSIEDWQSERSANVRSTADLNRFQEGGSADVSEFLSSEVERLPADIRAIHFVDLDEREIVNSSENAREGTQLNIVEAPWAWEEFDVANDEVYVSEVEEIQGAPTVSFVSPIPGEDTNRALVITTNLRTVTEGYDDDAVFTQVVNRDGNIVAGEQEQTQLEANLGEFPAYSPLGADSEIVQRGFAGETGFVDGTEKEGLDRDYVTAFAPVDGGETVDLLVTVHVPSDQAFALQSEITSSLLLLMFTTFVGLGAIAVTFGRGTVRSINQLSTKAEALKNGNLDEDFEMNRADEIGDLSRAFGSMRDALRDQIREAQTAREGAEEERERVERINDDLETAAEEYCAVMGAAADGDLSVRADVETENGQMRGIGEDFNAMLDEIEGTIGELKQFAMQVATASEEVTASSEEVRGASEQVTESIQEISDGADRQNDALQRANVQLSELSTAVDDISTTSTDVAEIAERTAVTGREGQSAAQNAIEGMSQIEAESEDTVEAMERLQEEITQIDELLEFITEIASQTNMLALNANIEASRSAANGSGDGFGVVAEEVKQLAAETKDAAEDIETRLERVKAETDRTAEEVRTTREQVSSQTESVKDAADALEEIAEYATETNEGVQAIDSATKEQATATREVVSVLDETATISEETSAESENVAAAAEQQTTALTEMSRSAGDLSMRASQLSAALDRFVTGEDIETTGLSDEGDPATLDTEVAPRDAAEFDDDPVGELPPEDAESSSDDQELSEQADEEAAVDADDTETDTNDDSLDTTDDTDDDMFAFVEDTTRDED
ncbi:methyl-accepting chemotaxis protein [Natronoarchaeum sp. GCM10025703]|uniref:methyl-accepting chemotaxis protein n=1 Tax=unclassified Natronoarchaeum TaxID=2620183 RepID=UPI003622A65A